MVESDQATEALPAPSTIDYTGESPQLEPQDELRWLTMAASKIINRTIDGDATGEQLGQLFETYRSTGESEQLIGVAFGVVALVGLHHVSKGTLAAREVLEAAPRLIIDTAEEDNIDAETFATQLADATEEFCVETAGEADVTDDVSSLIEPQTPTSSHFDRNAFNRLAGRAKQGDIHATNQLMAESAKWARIIIGKNGYYIPGGEREDITQEALMGVARAIRDYDPTKASFATLAELAIKRGIYTSIKQANRGKHTPLNNAVDLYSSPSGANTDGDHMLLDMLPNPGNGTEDKFLEGERLRALPHLLNRLSTLERSVTLLEAEGLSYTEVAQALRVNYKTVDNALQRVKKKFAKLGIDDFAEAVVPPTPDLHGQKPEPLPVRREKSVLQEAQGTFVNEGDLFTPRESLVLAEMTHCGNLGQLGQKLEVSQATISRITKPIRERFGVKTTLHLMLIAIAAGTANIDHVPEGMTRVFNEEDRERLSTDYNPDPAISASAFEKNKKSTSRYSRMYDKLELEAIDLDVHRWLTVLYAVKDGIIELPDISALQ